MKHLKSSKKGSYNKTMDTMRFLILTRLLDVERVFFRLMIVFILGFIGISSSFLFFGEAEAWERKTHRELTEQAIEFVASDLNAYLVDNLGLEGGLNASVDGMTVKQWLMEGSDLEDGEDIDFSSVSAIISSAFSNLRVLKHFHEPILNSGLGNNVSAIHWSLADLGSQSPGGPWSWNDAREYYFKALTSASKDERDENWGKTFRALGQVMHLLQDSANPSHVRDDPHPFNEGLHDFMAQRSVGAYIGGGIFSPDPSMLEAAGSAGPNGEPFANLFDRDMYLGSAPEATLGTNIGVTEYTNANFFSDDTIPGQGSVFSSAITHPAIAELVPAPVPSPYVTLPRLGSPTFPGARAAKLTGNEAAAKFLFTHTNLDLLGQLQLDDAVYDAYSHHLIPRAVGYSAAVLEYFFRGTVAPEGIVRYWDWTDPPNIKWWFSGPLDPGLRFGPGTLSLYYDAPDGTRLLVDSQPIGEHDSVHLRDVFTAEVPLALAHVDRTVPLCGNPLTVVFQGDLGPTGNPGGVKEVQGVMGWHGASKVHFADHSGHFYDEDDCLIGTSPPTGPFL